MNRMIQRWSEAVTMGTRQLLGLLIVVYLASWVLKFSQIGDAYGWLPLQPAAFWHGEMWRLMTYPLLPAGFVELLVNGLFVAFAASRLERAWSRGELWGYCLLVTVGGGLVKLALGAFSPAPLTGTATLVYGLLSGWARLFGHEEVLFLGLWRLRVRHLVILAVGLTLLMAFGQQPGAGWEPLLPLSGGVAGWAYLSLRWRRNRSSPSRLVNSKRISKLEV